MTTRIIVGNCLTELDKLPPESVNCVVTSPPYFGLRNYLDNPQQLGQEPTIAEYVANMVAVFDKLWRVLRKDGTAWLNLGDSYATKTKNNNNGKGATTLKDGVGACNYDRKVNAPNRKIDIGTLKEKDLCMIPARVAIALQDYGWYLRSAIVWHKTSAMPESVKDRPTKAHEMIYLLTKSARYWYDADAVREPLASVERERYRGTRADNKGFSDGVYSSNPDMPSHLDKMVSNPLGANLRDVWSIAGANYSDSHFATFPTEIPRRCILAGCPPGGVVLDPFGGAGTTALVAEQLGRDSILIELNQQYAEMARKRLIADCPMFNQVTVEPTNS